MFCQFLGDPLNCDIEEFNPIEKILWISKQMIFKDSQMVCFTSGDSESTKTFQLCSGNFCGLAKRWQKSDGRQCHWLSSVVGFSIVDLNQLKVPYVKRFSSLPTIVVSFGLFSKFCIQLMM